MQYCHSANRSSNLNGKTYLSCRGMQEILSSATRAIFQFRTERVAEKICFTWPGDLRFCRLQKNITKEICHLASVPVCVVFIQLYYTLLVQIN